jgi:hypothetical protein
MKDVQGRWEHYPPVGRNGKLPRTANARDHCAREHLHDRPARFRRRLRLDGDISARAANRVVDAVRIGARSPCEEEQRRESEERFFHSSGSESVARESASLPTFCYR